MIKMNISQIAIKSQQYNKEIKKECNNEIMKECVQKRTHGKFNNFLHYYKKTDARWAPLQINYFLQVKYMPPC